ncbi:MAG: 6-bladed beta-propeller [Spirochaetota bacterium]
MIPQIYILRKTFLLVVWLLFSFFFLHCGKIPKNRLLGLLTLTNLPENNSLISNSETGDTAPPVTGILTSSSNTSSTVVLNWTAATDDISTPNNLSYKLVYSTSDNIASLADATTNGIVAMSYTLNTNSYTVISLLPATTYYFNVLVKDEAGKEAIYSSISATTSNESSASNSEIEDTTPPSPGILSSSSSTSTTVVLNWTAATDNISAPNKLSYKLVYSTSDNIASLADASTNGIVAMNYTVNTNSYTVTSLLQTTTYYFNILVKDEAGKEAIYSSISATTPTISLMASLGTGFVSASNGGFHQPYRIAFDSKGFFYITDMLNHRVQKFDSNGNFILQWGSEGTENGQFGHPSGIAIDSNDDIYVLCATNGRIQKFDSGGNFLLKWGTYGKGNSQFSVPFGITIDNLDNIYVAEVSNHRVQKFDSNGNYLLKWGSHGTANGQFNQPHGLFADSSNNIYVTDLKNHRIQKFDSNGNYILQWGSLGSKSGKFNQPEGILSNNNKLYITDRRNHRVQVFSTSGLFLYEWGGYGKGNLQFNLPSGMAIRPDGKIYVVDRGNNRVRIFQ